jgi:L-lactate dehydrogenase complex protein LldF
VYERTGGHAYGSVYPGPIGAILSPQLTGTHDHADPNFSLPYASSLCGACFDACPVRIDIPSILVHLRAKEVDAERGGIPSGQDIAMKAAAWTMRSPQRFGWAERALAVGRLLAGSDQRISALPWPGSKWTSSRDVPAPPAETFRQWWSRTRDQDSQ